MLLVETLILSLSLQTIFFVFAAMFKTDKLTDLSYGLTFIFLGIFALSLPSSPAFSQYLLFTLVFLWAARLSVYLFIRILKTKKDKRFDGVREKPLKFARFWFLQALSVWIIMLPAIVVFASKEDRFSLPFLAAGTGIWLLGFVVETISDFQKYTYKNKGGKGFVSSGLWKYSQHPNYFGEITLWWGIFIFAFPFLSGIWYLTIIGPIYITLLICFVSGIPPLRKSYQARFGKDKKYQRYIKSTSLLIPLPVKKR